MAVCRDSSSISSLVIKVYFFVYQKYFARLNIALNSLSMLIVLSEHLYLPNQVGYHQSQYQK